MLDVFYSVGFFPIDHKWKKIEQRNREERIDILNTTNSSIYINRNNVDTMWIKGNLSGKCCTLKDPNSGQFLTTTDWDGNVEMQGNGQFIFHYQYT